MATIPTQNAVPSEAPRDLKFNSGKIDEFVTSLEHEYKDRFGRCHMTIEGMRWIFEQLMERFKVDINQAIIAAGYIPMDSFQLGAEITKRNEILRDETTGEYYRWDGDLPKSVPAGSTPESTGGVGMGEWVGVGDASLRSELKSGDGSLVGLGGGNTLSDLTGKRGAGLIGASDGRTVQEFLVANDSAEYRAKNIAKLSSVNYMMRTKQSINVLFHGDSMTAGYDRSSTDVVPANNDDWPTHTHASVTYPQRFIEFMDTQGGVKINPVYRAKSGYTSRDAYHDPAWQHNPNCDMAFVMYGINDSKEDDGMTHEEYMINMELIIRRLISWGMGVVVCTCAVGGQGVQHPKSQVWVQQVKNMAKIYGCAHFDAHEVQYNRMYGSVQSDGTHFNSAGYIKLAEMLSAMCLAGGLLETYESVKHEVQIWPGAVSNHIGFCNPDGNADIRYNEFAYTNTGLTGILPAGKRCIFSFHFYQDVEALDIDITGSWYDGGMRAIAGNWWVGDSDKVPYYSESGTLSNDRSVGLRRSFNSASLYKGNSASNGAPRFLGSIYGRGWKTITFFNDLDGNATSNQYIQMVTLRPVPLRKANGDNYGRTGTQIGSVGVMRRLYPDSRGKDDGAPPAVAFPKIRMPMPEALKGITNNNGSSYFDCSSVKVIIKCVGGTFGAGVMEGTLYKSSVGNGFTFTPTFKTGGDNSWPIFKFNRVGMTLENTYTAGSVGVNMPIRNIMLNTSEVSYDSGRGDMGEWITITADWSAVSGGQKTGYWDVQLWGIDFNGSPMETAY